MHGTAVIHIGAASSILTSTEKALNGARYAAYYSWKYTGTVSGRYQ